MVDNEVGRLLQLVKYHVIVHTALGLLFGWLEELFGLTQQAPFGLRYIKVAELRLVLSKAGYRELQGNGVGDGKPPAVPTLDVRRVDSASLTKPLERHIEAGDTIESYTVPWSGSHFCKSKIHKHQ